MCSQLPHFSGAFFMMEMKDEINLNAGRGRLLPSLW